MADKGGLEKMLILAYSDSKKAESGSIANADERFEVLINPETYTIDYKLKFSGEEQAPGTSGAQIEYVSTDPQELTVDFLFDNTGIIDGKPSKDIAEAIAKFRSVLIEYKGESHEPHHFKLVWGAGLIFKGRATEMNITYKMFNSDGTPTRAIVKVKFKGSIEEEKRVLLQGNSSPDLTHVRQVKEGDTLPLMCHKIYGDSKYYLNVAMVNRLDNFRSLVPGSTIFFPPIAKAQLKK